MSQMPAKRGRSSRDTQAPCSSCLRITTHRVLFEKAWTDEDWLQDQFTESFALLECAGCHRISMRHAVKYLDDRSSRNSYFPPPTSRQRPAWLLRLGMARSDETISELLDEVYQVVDSGQYRLAAMGVRALLEQIMILKIGDRGTFRDNLDAFQNEGYISTIQHDTMRNVLDIGDAAIHRGFKPGEDDLSLALDIVEAIIGTVLSHGEESSEMVKKLPQRASAKNRKTKKTGDN